MHCTRLPPPPPDPGTAVQVDPMKPTSKPPGSKRFKLEDEKLLSTFAYNFNLRRYTLAARRARQPGPDARGGGGLPAMDRRAAAAPPRRRVSAPHRRGSYQLRPTGPRRRHHRVEPLLRGG